MKVYKEYLNDNEIARLQGAIGLKINSIEGELLRESNNIYELFELLITLENYYVLNIFNEWKETPEENDYYKLHIEDNKVKEIKVNGELGLINIPFEGTIRSIEIYNFTGEWNGEILDYDVALCFTSSKSNKFLVYIFEDVSEQLELTYDEDIIKKEVKNFNLRLKLE